MDAHALSHLVPGALGALAVGLTGSLHCLLMCGPLACAGLGAPTQSPAARARNALAYQLGRWGAYTLVGALLGLVGRGLIRTFATSAQPFLPWVMAGALVFSALEVGKRLKPLPGLGRLAGVVARAGAKFSPAVRAGAIGAATPLLPCGLLYGIYLAAVAAGTAAGGALVMGAFALGGLPALLAAQLGAGRLQGAHPVVQFTLKRVVPLAAAVVLVFRAVTAGSPRCH